MENTTKNTGTSKIDYTYVVKCIIHRQPYEFMLLLSVFGFETWKAPEGRNLMPLDLVMRSISINRKISLG